MGLWILEDRAMEHVPGTTRFFDDPDKPQAYSAADHAGLKCDTSGAVPIVLVPQPSDDPNDPLNWPLWKRDLILCVLSLVSVLATSLGPILAANTLTLAYYFTLDFTAIALLTGYFLLGVGAAAIFVVPSSRVWGKRHAFIIGTVIIIGSSVWGGVSRSYVSMVWARILQGIGAAPFESLTNAVIGDLYFVHERGKRMALTNLAVFGGAFFTPIIVGKMTHTIGWPWSFYFVAIFTGACLPLVIFYLPETAYRRDAHLNLDMLSTEDLNAHEMQPTPPETGVQEKTIRESSSQQPLTAKSSKMTLAIPKKAPYSQTLRLFNGRKSDENFFKLLLRPFPLFAHPAILWACLIQGCIIGWTVFIGIILAAIFLGPPLFYDEVKTGYAYAGAFLGALIGFLIAGALADWSAKFMTRRNGGIYEPEFRIVLVFPMLIFCSIGLYGFGFVASRPSDFPHVLPIVLFGFEVAGMIIGAVAASLYIVDAHRDIAIEAFTCLIIFKNFFSFGLTESAYQWLIDAGTLKCFLWISSIQVLVCLTAVPMYVFGKKNRSFFHRHDLLKMFKLT